MDCPCGFNMDGSPNPSPQKNTALLVGILPTLVGFVIILVAADIIHADPASIHAPRWVLALAGMVFAFAGLSTLSQSLFTPAEQRSPALRWTQYFLGLGIFASFAATFLWIGFGPGERQFSGSASFLFFRASGQGDELLGRIIFGGGGILSALLTAYFAYTGASKIRNNTDNYD